MPMKHPAVASSLTLPAHKPLAVLENTSTSQVLSLIKLETLFDLSNLF